MKTDITVILNMLRLLLLSKSKFNFQTNIQIKKYSTLDLQILKHIFNIYGKVDMKKKNNGEGNIVES